MCRYSKNEMENEIFLKCSSTTWYWYLYYSTNSATSTSICRTDIVLFVLEREVYTKNIKSSLLIFCGNKYKKFPVLVHVLLDTCTSWIIFSLVLGTGTGTW